MKSVFLFSLMVLTALQQIIALQDSTLIVTRNYQSHKSIIKSKGKSIIASQSPPNWDFLSENSLGDNSVWTTPENNIEKIYPLYWFTTYIITFKADCPQNEVIFSIASTAYFKVVFNENLIQNWQQPWPSTSTIHLSPICGQNTIQITVYNYLFASPAGIIYTLTKNTTGCYTCLNKLHPFYNKTSCKCQCAANTCTQLQYLNPQTCTCQCINRTCPTNRKFSQRTCRCFKAGCKEIFFICKTGQIWSEEQCKCIPTCPDSKPCTGIQIFGDTCKCQCPYELQCNGYAQWNKQTCSCYCDQRVTYTMKCYFDFYPQVCNCILVPPPPPQREVLPVM